MTRRRGRRVARLPAVMPSPASMLDQMAIWRVASGNVSLYFQIVDGEVNTQRKLSSAKVRTKGMRTMTADEALESISR